MWLIDVDELPNYKLNTTVEVGEHKGPAEIRIVFWKDIEKAPTIDAVPVVRCKDCKHRGTPYNCPMRKLVMPWQGAGSYEDCTEDEGYCHMGKRKDGGA